MRFLSVPEPGRHETGCLEKNCSILHSGACRWMLFLLLPALLCVCSGKSSLVITDPKSQKPMLVGECSRRDLEKHPFKAWFDKEYDAYQLDTASLQQLKNQWRDIGITLVLATWCGDSRREVPRFYKILDYVKFDTRMLKVYSVDRSKKAGKTDLSALEINFVPTIIIYRKHSEMGRIIEKPASTLEKDLFRYIGLTD